MYVQYVCVYVCEVLSYPDAKISTAECNGLVTTL